MRIENKENFYRYMTDEELIEHQKRKDLSLIDIMAPWQYKNNILMDELSKLVEKEKDSNGR